MRGPRSGMPIAPNVPASPASSSSVAGSKHELSDGTPGGHASARRVMHRAEGPGLGGARDGERQGEGGDQRASVLHRTGPGRVREPAESIPRT